MTKKNAKKIRHAKSLKGSQKKGLGLGLESSKSATQFCSQGNLLTDFDSFMVSFCRQCWGPLSVGMQRGVDNSKGVAINRGLV